MTLSIMTLSIMICSMLIMLKVATQPMMLRIGRLNAIIMSVVATLVLFVSVSFMLVGTGTKVVSHYALLTTGLYCKTITDS